jgi:hypothetical protein
MSVSTGELANRSTSTERAAQLEVHAAEFPEQRGMLLLEAALAWRRAGQSQRATQLIDGLIATGGEDGCYARVQRVEFCLADDAWPQAEAQLAILAHEPSLYEGHCTLIAELLIEHHRLQAAARWYDRGLARLTPQTLRALAGPRGFTQLGALTMLRGRRDLSTRRHRRAGDRPQPMAITDGHPARSRHSGRCHDHQQRPKVWPTRWQSGSRTATSEQGPGCLRKESWHMSTARTDRLCDVRYGCWVNAASSR